MGCPWTCPTSKRDPELTARSGPLGYGYMRNKRIVQETHCYSEKLTGYCDGDAYSYDEFAADAKLVEACAYNLCQLEELSRSVDVAIEESYPEIPWWEMVDLRSRVVHDCEGVNSQLVWEIISEDVTKLRETLERMC